MKILRRCAQVWLALVALVLLVWMLTGIWLLHSPEGDGRVFLMGLCLAVTSFASIFCLVESR